MALARCDDHQPAPEGADYLSYVLPVGHPDAVDCALIGCINPARLWLTEAERRAFLDGARSFGIEDGTVMPVEGDLFPN
jgi:hypothetical protein